MNCSSNSSIRRVDVNRKFLPPEAIVLQPEAVSSEHVIRVLGEKPRGNTIEIEADGEQASEALGAQPVLGNFGES